MNRSCLLTAPDPGSSKTKRVRRESIVFPFNAKTSDMSATGSTCEAAARSLRRCPLTPGSLQARPLTSAVTGRRFLNIARVRELPGDEQNRVAEFPLDFASPDAKRATSDRRAACRRAPGDLR